MTAQHGKTASKELSKEIKDKIRHSWNVIVESVQLGQAKGSYTLQQSAQIFESILDLQKFIDHSTAE
jgi:hypothetical protein